MENLEKKNFNRTLSIQKNIQLKKQHLTTLNFNWLKIGKIDITTYNTNLKEILLAQTFDQLETIKNSTKKMIDLSKAKETALIKNDMLYREGRLSFSEYKKNKLLIFSFTTSNSLTKYF